MERARTRTIRDFILEEVAAHPGGLARRVAQAYGISRQAANRHVDAMVEAGLLEETGKTRARRYALRRVAALTRDLRVTPVLNPNRVWDDTVAPLLRSDPAPVQTLARDAFRELVRSAVDHADATWISFVFAATARHLDVTVADDGRGFFETLAARRTPLSPSDLADEIARLARVRSMDSPVARLTLLARNFESFCVQSAGTSLVYDGEHDTWTVHHEVEPVKGTSVSFRQRRTRTAAARADADTIATAARG